MWEEIVRFFSGAFMPHGHCYLWSPAMVGLQLSSNLAIGLAYISISATLYYLVRRVKDVPFSWMYVAFGVFIVTCGGTHVMDVVTIWTPVYWLDGGLRAVTAVASVGTALMLFPLVPKAVALADAAQQSHARGIALEKAYADLAVAHEKAREFERLKTQFFANASHELRTPLTLILGPLDRVARSASLPSAEREDLEIALRNARILLRHVNDLLDLSKIESGRIEPRWARTDVSDLIRGVGSLFESFAREERFTLEVLVPNSLEAEVDPEALRRIVLNLLSNAAKYTPAGGRVRIEVAAIGDSLRLRVEDDGPGIPDDLKAVVFDRYRQVEGSDHRRIAGSGLGLAIVKEFVELHGGEIHVEDPPGGGTAIVITLPRSAPEGSVVRPSGDDDPTTAYLLDIGGAAAEPEDEPPARGDRPRVLVVEDNADMRRYTRSTLADHFDVEVAVDGIDGLERAKAAPPDLIVTDLMMPRMRGDALVEALRATPSLADVPVVVLSARADDAARVEVLRKGAQDYLVKPFAPDELRTRVSNLVEMAAARARLRRELHTEKGNVSALVDELADKTRALEAALEVADKASRAKTAFLNLVSHELRTPVATLQFDYELLRRDGDATARTRALTRSGRALRRLSDQLEGLLEFASLQSGRLVMRPEPFDATALAERVVEGLRRRAADKGLTLRVESSGIVGPLESDPQLVCAVLRPIVDNAIKHSSAGEVVVRVRQDRGEHHFVIVDHGPGIPAEQREKIFEPFEGLEPVSHKHTAGIGLGLAIARRILEALGGRLDLESAEGVGSTFTCSLPSTSARAA
jgi:signal transduction histidine kinase